MQLKMGRLGVAAAVAAAGCGTLAGTAGANTMPPDWHVDETPGTRIVVVPVGATAVELSATGGRGGGVNGGRGAVVTGTVAVRGGQLLIVGVGRAGGNAVAGTPAPGTTLPGEGGGDSTAAICDPTPGTIRCAALSRRVLTAAGGGGSGGGTTASPGGAGGDADADGANGAHNQLGMGAGLGGLRGTIASGGAGGAAVAIPEACMTGISAPPGVGGAPGSGGRGGGYSFAETMPSRIGGSGGDGLRGGGGGSAAVLCDGAQAGAGGGGGGASQVPAGGTLGLSDAFSVNPGVRYRFVIERVAPTVAIAAPLDGAVYAQNAAVSAAYTCADEAGGSGIASCAGTVAAGAALDTAAPGRRQFTVTARDAAGNETVTTVSYTVKAVIVGAVRANARTIAFRASGPLRATVRIERRAPGRKARWKLVSSRALSARAGANTVATARRALAPGRYRAVVTVSGANGLPKPKPVAFTVRAKKRARAR